MSANQPARRPLSRKKRLLFGATIFATSFALVELLSWIAISSFYVGKGFEPIRDAQEQLALSGISPENRQEVIHPYLGWVLNPDTNLGTDFGGRRIAVNNLGLNDDSSDIPRRAPDRLVVGVLGGSVAWQMSVEGEAALRESLGQHPPWREREIRIVRLAMSGYKQPQQLMCLNYLLALGAEFDVIVNIDGYNEIALPVKENNAAGVSTAYPRMWHAKLVDLVDPRTNSMAFRVLELRAARQEWAQWILKSSFRWSATANLVWKVRDTWWQTKAFDLAHDIQRHADQHGRNFAADGPRERFADEAELYSHLRDLWMNSSLQLHRLCVANRIQYVHVLQPNQYVPDSKPMSEAERKVAHFHPGWAYGRTIPKGFPLLIEAGARLREQGVNFCDLTRLFADVEQPVYADAFCHYNAAGNELLARAVAVKIIEGSGEQ